MTIDLTAQTVTVAQEPTDAMVVRLTFTAAGVPVDVSGWNIATVVGTVDDSAAALGVVDVSTLVGATGTFPVTATIGGETVTLVHLRLASSGATGRLVFVMVDGTLVRIRVEAFQ